MHGDITRDTFDPDKRYSSVRSLQGRALLDADRNENTDILIHDTRSGRIDVIGREGAPLAAPGFEITESGGELHIGAGRYYVDGIRIESESASPYTDQPSLPGAALPTEGELYLAYLDVWERPITAIQDPHSREVALGGPDTTQRAAVVWQVKLLPVAGSGSGHGPLDPFPEWDALIAGSTGTLEVREAPPAGDSGPCVVPEEGGYRGLENQLYRIEIHEGNVELESRGTPASGATATFKWSRDNGAVIGAWREHPSTLDVVVDRVGPGGAQGFDVGAWAELTDDRAALREEPGILARIDAVDGSTLRLEDDGAGTIADALTPSPRDEALHPAVRRWDSSWGARATATTSAEHGGAEVTADGWIRIERGIEVRFDAGTLRPGDFWLIPARTALLPGEDARIDWPRDTSGVPLARGPHGPKHHYARLALVRRTGSGWDVLGDARRFFPSLTETIQLSMRGGDGQHARSGHWLPAPVRVGVSRGEHPVAGATVRFRLVPHEGAIRGGLRADPPAGGGAGAVTDEVEVVTDASGIAHAYWRLGDAADPGWRDRYRPEAAQQLEAVLVASDGAETHLATRFVATAVDGVTLRALGGDAQVGAPGETLPVALRVLVSDGTRPVKDAHVHFRVMSMIAFSDPLDAAGGGFIHASVVELHAETERWERWPEGSHIAVIVKTNDEGIASVQWTLGREPRLPTQRVDATLLDEDGAPTAQAHRFAAHRALPGDTSWTPCKPLRPFLPESAPPDGPHNVQMGLDAVCRALRRTWTLQQYLFEQLTGQPAGPLLGSDHFVIDPQKVRAWVALDVVVGTSAGSTPLSPGDRVDLAALQELHVVFAAPERSRGPGDPVQLFTEIEREGLMHQVRVPAKLSVRVSDGRTIYTLAPLPSAIEALSAQSSPLSAELRFRPWAHHDRSRPMTLAWTLPFELFRA